MHLRTIAIVGSVSWIFSELLERSSGGLSSASLALTAFAFATLAMGVWGLGGHAPRTRAWSIATAVWSLGFGLMAAVSVDMWRVGATAHVEGPLFFAAVGTFTLGLLGTGVLAITRHDRWIGASFLAAGVLALGANLAEVGPLASAANIAASLLMVRMAMPPAPIPAPA